MSRDQVAAPTRVQLPGLPVRSLAIGAAGAMAGAVLMVLGGQFSAPVVIGLGGVLLVAASALAAWSLVRWRRGRLEVVMDAQGYRVAGPQGLSTGAWSEVSRVTRSPGRLTLYRAADEDALVIAAADERTLDYLGALVARRLDRDRGYESL